MSENSAGTTGSSMDSEEPSMEDILASIRKIISDDEVSELNVASTEDVKSDDTVFDVEDMGLSNDSDFGFEAFSKDDSASTVELTNPENNLLVEEFDSDELDNLLSFDELEIPDSDQPNIDLNAGHVLPTVQLAKNTIQAENTIQNAVSTNDASILDTLDLIGQSDAGESVSLNLDANDLDNTRSDTLPLNNVELENSFDDISALNDLDALMDENLDLTSIPESNATDALVDEGIDLSELDFAFDDDLTSQGEMGTSKTKSSSIEDTSSVQKVSTETDIDLVKSLMADLTDDSFFDEETSEDVRADQGDDTVDLSSSISPEALVIDETDSKSPSDVQSFEDDEAAVMDEILSMAMDDETGVDVEEADNLDVSLEEEPLALDISDTETEESEQSVQVEDEKSAESDQIVEDDEINTLMDDNLKVASTTSALQDIARRAASSADEAELTEPRESMLSRVWDKMDAVIGSDVHVENVNSEDDNALDDDVQALEDSISDDASDSVEYDENPADVMSAIAETEELDSLDANLLNESKETLEMPKAIRSETILNEVTEKATTGAFAELNHVVEEKAIYEERGARIGDLVQEALRPMLKEWLDANLKGIVERAVAKEVKRISTGK